MPVMSRSEYEAMEKENIKISMRESYKHMDRVVDELLTSFNERLKSGIDIFPYKITYIDVICKYKNFTIEQQKEILHNVQQALIAKGWDARYKKGFVHDWVVVFKYHSFWNNFIY